MSLLSYYRTLLCVAFRHSLGAAQGVVYLLVIAVGFVTWLHPPLRGSVDMTSWQVAAIVLGSIVAIRLLLAPYWMHQQQQAKLDAATKRDGPPWLFQCDFSTVERLCQLVPQVREDAIGYLPHQPEMIGRLRELQSHSAIFTAAGLTNEYRSFLNYVGDAIARKETYLSPAYRTDMTKWIDEVYPNLKEALADDYAKRRAERR